MPSEWHVCGRNLKLFKNAQKKNGIWTDILDFYLGFWCVEMFIFF